MEHLAGDVKNSLLCVLVLLKQLLPWIWGVLGLFEHTKIMIYRFNV
jgi:hypothetical protein